MSAEIESHERQWMQEGVGPIYHRVYAIRLGVPFARARAAMRELQKDPNRFSPQLLATFEKKTGAVGILQRGDEFQILITGPWNGPVRVAEVGPDFFRLITLAGHLEAGAILFRVKAVGRQDSVFEIESMARSRDAVVDFVYDKVPIAKCAQTEMWTSFCRAFAEYAGGLAGGGAEVEILTERREGGAGPWERI